MRPTFLAAFLLWTWVSSWAAGVDNDLFAHRVTLAGAVAEADIWLLDAGREQGEPNHAPGPIQSGASVWWTWTAPDTGYFALESGNRAVAVYRGDALDQLSLVTRTDIGTGRMPQALVQQGETFQIAVNQWPPGFAVGWLPDDVPLKLRVTLHPVSVNDAFADRTRLGGNEPRLQGNFGGATREPGEPDHGIPVDMATLWWEWTPPASGMAGVTQPGGRTDLLRVYRGSSLAGLTPVNLSDTYGQFAVTAGEPVQLAVISAASEAVGGPVESFAIGLTLSSMRIVAPPAGLNLNKAGPLRLEVENQPSGSGQWFVWDVGRDSFDLGTSPAELRVPHLEAGKHRIRVRFLSSTGTHYLTPEVVVTVQGGSDSFSRAAVISESSMQLGAVFSTATVEPDEPPLPDSTTPASGSVWWRWTAPSAGRIRLGSATPSAVRFELFSGASLDRLVSIPLAPLADRPELPGAEIAEPGGEYRIRLTRSGDLPMEWGEVAFAFQAKAPDDDISSPTPLQSGEFSLTLPPYLSGYEPGEPGDVDSESGSRWLAVTPASDSVLALELRPFPNPYAAMLEVFSGGAMTDLVPVAGPAQNLQVRLAGGQSYRVKVTLPNAWRSPEDFRLQGWLAPLPENDDFAHAIPLPPVDEGTLIGSNRIATTEPGDPEPFQRGRSVWYRFTAPEHGALVVRVDAADVGHFVPLNVGFVTGTTVGNLRWSPNGMLQGNQAAIELNAGEDIAVLIWGPGPDAPPAPRFTLQHRFIAVPANDSFGNRIALTGNRVVTRGTNWLASREPGEPLAHSRGSGRTTWWTWTAPANGYLDISCANLLAGLFTGGSLSTLNPIQPIDLTNRFLGGLRFPVVAGTSYQLQLDRDDPFAERSPFGPNGLQGTDLGLRLSSVVLASPSNRAVLNGDHPLRFALAALDPALDETPQSVTFWMWTNHVANQKVIPLGTVTTPPFELELPRFAPGQYLFEAVVTNAAGESGLSPVASVRIAPANDDFADAAVLVGHKFTETAFWSGASVERGEPSGVPAGRGSIWYRWTAPASGSLGVALFGSGNFDLYSGASLGGLRVMPWSGTAGREYAVTNGNTYHLRIIGGAEVPGAGSKNTFSMDLRSVAFVTPAAGAKIATGQSVPIRLRITAAPETVGWVELRAGTNLIATVQGPGWSFTWQKPPPGLQTILASVVSPTGKVLSEVSRQVLVASPNDLVSAPIQLEGASGRTEVNGLAATPDLPGDSSGYVWYRWVAPGDGVLFTRLAFSNATPALVLFSGAEPTSWQQVTNRLGDSFTRSVGQWAVRQGATYWLGVTTSSFEPSGELFWEWAPVAANDAFSSRLNLIGDGAEMMADFVLASLEEGEPFSWQPPSDLRAKGSLWWNWVPPQSGLLEITLPPGEGQSVTVIVGKGTRLATFEPVGDSRPLEQTSWFPIPESRLYPVIKGQAVQIALLSVVPDARNVRWSWRFHPVPANDHFASRSVVDSSQPARGSLLGATLEAGAPAVAAPPFSDVWWTWTAPGDGEVGFQINEGHGSHFLGVYRGNTLSGLEPVVFYSTMGTEPEADFVPVRQGQVLQLRLGLWGGPGGDYGLGLTYRPRPENDDFDGRIPLTGDQVRISGANWRSSREFGEPHHADHFGGRSVWYSWQAPADGEAVVTFRDGSQTDRLLLAAYQGNAVTSLRSVGAVAVGAERTPLRFAARAGEHYALAIDGSFGLTTTFSLDLQLVSAPTVPPRLDLEFLPDNQLRVVARQVPGGTWILEECADLSHWIRVADVPAGEVHSLTIPAEESKALRLFRLRR